MTTILINLSSAEQKMNPIHWLRLIKTTPRIRTKIDGHYILKVKEKFMVFTSKPVTGINCEKISDVNIKGENKAQYLAKCIHSYDGQKHSLSQPTECILYYTEHKTKLKQHIDNLSEQYIG